ncbi:peptidoglycan bridge formation glycyltransferase FemA/FemB family protein [Priestia megaterium]|uniref:peptidoglycan bridge formation glycyltransferase FemA/FemB family protein n=1 Tax=Priestia megaterium TaxID=1404 RepID=UPI0034E25BD8
MENELDIYFDDNYGKLYEKVENGSAETFNFNCRFGTIKNQFIKREIPIKINTEIYYDIVTPYGYGGPVIIKCEENKEDELLIEYAKAFSHYCEENNIVSEFIRFHPILQNAEDFTAVYDVECIRKTLGTNLKDFEDPFQIEFSKSCRKNIRKALNKGVSFKIVEKPSNVKEFKEIYYSTMDRNNATDYYYFDGEYFDKALALFTDNIITVSAIYDGKTIAQGFYFVFNKTIHIHLSGTLSEYLYLSPAYILRYAVTLWGKEKGYELIHHGGGRTNSEDDNLYKFKKSFSKNTNFNFCIGKKIWNKEVFRTLCKNVGVDEDSEVFPAYRNLKDEQK